MIKFLEFLEVTSLETSRRGKFNCTECKMDFEANFPQINVDTNPVETPAAVCPKCGNHN